MSCIKRAPHITSWALFDHKYYQFNFRLWMCIFSLFHTFNRMMHYGFCKASILFCSCFIWISNDLCIVYTGDIWNALAIVVTLRGSEQTLSTYVDWIVENVFTMKLMTCSQTHMFDYLQTAIWFDTMNKLNLVCWFSSTTFFLIKIIVLLIDCIWSLLQCSCRHVTEAFQLTSGFSIILHKMEGFRHMLRTYSLENYHNTNVKKIIDEKKKIE